ncbi:ABC transporter permease [Camelliibacillus cellulosilyticus]|uniref:ABC transporter permease n=2 Tax=Camelliibacillus cellulosilyticus TaxID=2174486 RepID=A0ABV9GK59_9BACL
MFDFPKGWTFHVGKYVSDIVDWLTVHLHGFFDAIKNGLLWVLLNFNDFLVWVPWWFVILAVFLLTLQYKTLTSAIVFVVFLFLIGLFGYWDMMMFTFAIVLASVIISLVIGIPLGILMAYNSRFEVIVKPILDAMQTMPTFVYLIPAIFFFGLGLVPGVLATIIYALPPVMRLTNLAIRGVPNEVVEAGLSFGSSRWQLLTKVQIPQALPTIMAGINQTTMMALAMVVVASMVGVKGLGLEVLTALNQIDVAKGFEAGISIVFLAIIVDRLTLAISDRFQKQ